MIAVTGATGQLGRLIIEQLLLTVDPGQIVAIARSPEKADDLAEKGVIVCQGDYDQVESLMQGFDGVDVLMFISNTDVMRRKEQHQNVIDAARKAGIGRVVYTSFIAVNDDNQLGPGHLATEESIKAAGLAYTFLRPNFYADMYVVEVEIAMKSGTYRSPSGEAGAAFISRSDVARAAAAALTSDEHTGKIYELTGPSAVTPAEFAAIASRLSGRSVVYQPISWDELAEDYRARGMPEQWVPMSIMLEQLIASNVLAKVSDGVERLTGKPPTSFEDFVRASLN
jgi:NAD(P)H dehydrogenase (quinone)